MILIEWLSYFIIGISWVLVVGSFLGATDKKDSDKNRIANFNLFFIALIVTAICALLIYFIN
jgi:hypothetical protein|tara:strand:- start:402 stop:587 length:186 start_codon:yes stop_codon:yes gene_type:complete